MNQADVSSDAVPLVDDDAAKSAPFTRLIAHLSVCMLTASFGAMVGPYWCRWWAIFGVLGLASAVGLDLVNRSRARRADSTRRNQLILKAGRKLDKLIDDVELSGATCAALRQLQPDAADPRLQGTACQAEPRMPLNKSATITRLLRYSSRAVDRLGKPLVGRVRNISHQGFGLAHDERLEQGLVLLEIDLENGEPLQFIADVLWCELQDSGGYFSGGKIFEVVSPSEGHPAYAR
jgi:hypothetical protein